MTEASWHCDQRNAYEPDKGCSPFIRPQKKTTLKGDLFVIGAGEGIRTLDINLGKVALYP